MQRYVIYHRVSTADQGRSGLGLAAQERDVALFLEGFAPRPHEVIAIFREVQSGADNDRPELEAALALVRRTPGCELLVAKLDRLARSHNFTSRRSTGESVPSPPDWTQTRGVRFEMESGDRAIGIWRQRQ